MLFDEEGFDAGAHDVRRDAERPGGAELRARGINSLTLDAATSMIWNKADQTITVRDLALDASHFAPPRVASAQGELF